jgi:hypothetical protein
LKPAPYQPVTTTLIRSTPIAPFKPGHSSVDKIPISERELHRVTLPDSPALKVKEIAQVIPEVTETKVLDELSLTKTEKKSNKDTDGDEISGKDKKTIKKYGTKLDKNGSPSRSRSTTKELIRE